MKYDFDTPVNREHTDCYKYDLRERIFGRGDVIPMWIADMDFSTPPFIMNALRNRLDHEILGYTYIREGFYQTIVNWMKIRHGWDIEKNWISFSPGVVPALNLLVMAFTNPGDAIIVQPPVYFPFFSAVQNHERKLVTNPLQLSHAHYSIDFGHLRSIISRDTKMLFLCSPHNPTGNVWHREELERLANLCVEHNIILVSDEIHSDLILPGFKHTPAAGLSKEIADITITCMAPSKTFNLAGLSTSFLVISNPDMRRKYEEILDRVHVGAGNIFGFIASEAAYEAGHEWLDQLMLYLQENLSTLTDYFRAFIPEIRVIQPEATYMVWLDCRKLTMTREELRDFMISEAGLGLSEGSVFGEGGTGFMRMNIACPRSLLVKALEQLHRAVVKHRNK